MQSSDARNLLNMLFETAVRVADPMEVIEQYLPEKPPGRVLVIGAGKASARMAEAVEEVWGPCEGLVITRYGYGRPTKGVEIVEAAHPVPDAAGEAATGRMLELLSALNEDDFVLALISGGASALLIKPIEGLSLEDKRAVNSALLSSGAPIGAMNTVRKHLSQVKGGQLAAAAYPAKMLALMISDVPGDDMAFIGSGPTVGDASSVDDALAVIERWNVPVDERVKTALAEKSGVIAPGDERLSRVENRVVIAPSQSLAAAEELARNQGVNARLLGDSLEGEARDVAQEQAREAMVIQKALGAGDQPVLLMSGGELTVTRRGDGIGGPNAEFCLAAALALNGAPGIHLIACDTDGVDGAAEVAGAIVTPDTLKRAGEKSIDPKKSLAENDAHRFFEAIGDQVVPGPTLTNVNDFRAILIEPV